jgi:phosphoserine phosphatase
MHYPWQLQVPLDGIVFDCDGTLCHIEGIDELAHNSGHYTAVSEITTDCMSNTGLNEASYAKRLQLIKPSRGQIYDLIKLYLQHITPGAKCVIEAMLSLGKEVYIVSSGIAEAIIPFGEQLGLKTENIYAVSLSFNTKEEYNDFDRSNPLVHSGGKLTMINKIIASSPRIAFIGDGISDYEAAQPVTRFIGYGGMQIREKIASVAPCYLLCTNLYPLLPLCLTKDETVKLNDDNMECYQKGIVLIEQGKVIIHKE